MNPSAIIKNLSQDNDFCFFDSVKIDRFNRYSYLFTDPVDIITTNSLSQVKRLLRQIEKAKKRYYLGGFLSYELADFVEPTIGFKQEYDFPLLWFGIYKKPIVFKTNKSARSENRQSSYFIQNHRVNITDREYFEKIKKIKNYIRKGQTYQINFTYKDKFNFFGSPIDFYFDLRSRQPTGFSAYIHFKDSCILSLSPELFFRKRGSYIYTRPMKGTIKKGKNIIDNRNNMKALRASAKDRSENIMIVDLIRNDLARISIESSVQAFDLFRIEKYKSLLQMTSSVKAKVDKDICFFDLIKNVFPSGSVTGAPKISSMKLIKALEKEPRRIYTGSVGFITPDNDSCFNVSIRTVLIDKKKHAAEMGIGSGIVYDSISKKELKECRLKADFLTHLAQNEFKLIETILFSQKEKYFLLDYHFKRLSESASFFDYSFKASMIKDKLNSYAKRLKLNSCPYKVRLLLSKQGKIQLTHSRLNTNRESLYVKISPERIDPSNIFLYHKTTNRSIYDRGLRKSRASGLFDFIYLNQKNEICESSIGNVVIKKGSFFFTPPISCGLLPGVYRDFLISKSLLKNRIKEKILFMEDLVNCDKIFIINSVIKMFEVKLLTK
ncbi:MAG: bifunctional anthranilate synthase component I family protein/class IV aminotransferase [Candidatus Gygaella obscura]|nr:bifunctional anthranilate synthase component I family protein/class IV aminotransferase [Candidatus Gygaella obscura]